MATPRKRWFTVECSLYREPWPRDVKLSLVMLGMLMSDRWAADKLTAKQATVVHLSLGDMLTITGKETREEAREIFRQITSLVTIQSTDLQNGFLRVVWPKTLKTQTWHAREKGLARGTAEPGKSPRRAPRSAHQLKLKRKREEKSAPPDSGESELPPEAHCDDLLLLGERAIANDRQLLNRLGNQPGKLGEKEHWLASEIDKMKECATAKRPLAAMVIGWYQTYLADDRKFRDYPTFAERHAMEAKKAALAAEDAERAKNPPPSTPVRIRSTVVGAH